MRINGCIPSWRRRSLNSVLRRCMMRTKACVFGLAALLSAGLCGSVSAITVQDRFRSRLFREECDRNHLGRRHDQ